FNGSTPSTALTELLGSDPGSSTWVAATVGANQAAGYQLATGDPIMAIGGFNGTDPTPTLAQFERYVSEGKIKWFVAGGEGGGGLVGGGTSSTARQIASWVEAHYTAQTVGNITAYNLIAPAK
ncbi:MAG: glycosyl transferase, partial [Acidimicrobiales bacterium]